MDPRTSVAKKVAGPCQRPNDEVVNLMKLLGLLAPTFDLLLPVLLNGKLLAMLMLSVMLSVMLKLTVRPTYKLLKLTALLKLSVLQKFELLTTLKLVLPMSKQLRKGRLHARIWSDGIIMLALLVSKMVLILMTL